MSCTSFRIAACGIAAILFALLVACSQGAATLGPAPAFTSGAPGTTGGSDDDDDWDDDGWDDDRDDDDGADDDDDSDSDDGGSGSDGSEPCVEGELGCPCTEAGKCDDGLMCTEGICLVCGACGECGDQVCNVNETCGDCPEDCGACPGCGDDNCDEDLESCRSCPEDCGPCDSCGDDVCAAPDDCFNCPQDCGECLPSCGDDVCEGDECETCPGDCAGCSDPCENAASGNGDYCGAGLGGDANLLYTCVGDTTAFTTACANGCAACPPGQADLCKAYGGQSDDEACGTEPECDETDASACGGDEMQCVDGSCQECASGWLNCNNVFTCECNGLCDGNACVECDYYAEPDGCGGGTNWCYQNECQSCSPGFANCDETWGCECEGSCDGDGNCVPS